MRVPLVFCSDFYMEKVEALNSLIKKLKSISAKLAT